MSQLNLNYDSLPEEIRNNLTEDQFRLSMTSIVAEGEHIPETTEYIDLGSGMIKVHQDGDRAPGNLLPTSLLSGARGKSYTQWES